MNTERRHAERAPLVRSATLRLGRHSQSATMTDVSSGGACIRCDTSLVSVGEPATLSVGSLRVRGVVAWSSMDRIGLRFDGPLSGPAMRTLID